jgi:nucleotide-binding universal stress UspA family protein
MKAPKRVVVGVDGSNESTEAIQWAAQYAASTGAVVEAWTSWNFPALSGIAYDVTNWEANARETLDIALARALPNGSNDIERYTVQEHPGAALIAAAKGADVVVVGARGHGAFAGMLLGSVSQHVVAHARCPVVAVRHTLNA